MFLFVVLFQILTLRVAQALNQILILRKTATLPLLSSWRYSLAFASGLYILNVPVISKKKKKKSAPQRRPSNESEGSKSMPGSRSATPTKGSTEAPPKGEIPQKWF